MRHNHDTHLLFESQSECAIYHLEMNFIIKNDNESYIIENDDPMTYLKIVMSRDSDRWLGAMTFKMDSLYINQI